MLKSFFIVGLFATIILGCAENLQSDSTKDFSESVYILHDIRDTSLHNYYDEIMESRDFVDWRFNWNNPDTSKIIGHSSFSYRTLKIQDKIYFETDLTSFTFVQPHISNIPTKHVCTFRFDLKNKTIKIFNRLSEKFIDYRTAEGKNYFKSKLDE